MLDLSTLNPVFEYDAVDEKVWREELDPFLPSELFDFHGHVYLPEHAPSKGRGSRDPSQPDIGLPGYPHEVYAEVQRRLWPGRRVRALVFGTVAADADIAATNGYAAEAAREHGWDALMVPPMGASADELLTAVRAGGFLGFKPYWTFVRGKKPAEVTLEDMVTPAMREAADRGALIMTVHIPRPGRLADPVNIDGLRRLCREAPRATVVLAHLGRSYFPEAIGRGLELADLPNLYPELSMVQDWEVVEAVLKAFDRRRVLFGLDLPVAQEKGRCMGVNGQRHFFTKRPHAWSAHVPPGGYEVKCTLFAYEMARAIRKASERLGLSRAEIEGIFAGNAARLVRAVRDERPDEAAAPRPRQLMMVWPRARLDSPPAAAVPDGYRLRGFEPADEVAHLELMAKAGFAGWDGAKLATAMRKIIPGGFLVVEHLRTGRLVAAAMATHSPREGRPYAGELGWVAGDPEHAGRGLGMAVCAAATALLVRRGYAEVYLLTDDWRLPAVRTYLKTGFVPVLSAPDMEGRWRSLCEALTWPFTPAEWARE